MGILNCNSSPINFKEYNSIFRLLNSMEAEITYFENQRKNSEKQSEEYRLYSNYISKVTSILNFLKNKPLIYIVERFESFKDIVNRFYYSVYTTNLSEYNKAKNELEEFIFRMNDFNNGIRFSVSPVEIEENNKKISEYKSKIKNENIDNKGNSDNNELYDSTLVNIINNIKVEKDRNDYEESKQVILTDI